MYMLENASKEPTTQFMQELTQALSYTYGDREQRLVGKTASWLQCTVLTNQKEQKRSLATLLHKQL